VHRPTGSGALRRRHDHPAGKMIQRLTCSKKFGIKNSSFPALSDAGCYLGLTLIVNFHCFFLMFLIPGFRLHGQPAQPNHKT
jgi:hypothetical protein